MDKQRIKNLIREITKEIVDEITTTGSVAAYQTPYAFQSGPADKARKKKIAQKSMPGGTVVKDIYEEVDEADVGANLLAASLRNPLSYAAIDQMMQTVAKKSGISTKKLRDSFVEKHGKSPDDYAKEFAGKTIGIVRRDLFEGRSRYKNFKESDLMKNHAKVSYGIYNAKKILREVDFLISISERLKTEESIDTSNLWKRTQKDIIEIQQRIKEIEKKIINITQQ